MGDDIPILGLQLTDTQQNSRIYIPVREGMPVGGSVSGEHVNLSHTHLGP
jgi:hypothetical protein